MRLDWQRLHTLAQEEVAATLAALPPPLRERAQALPVTFERRPNAAHRRDGIEPDTLGLFVGPEFAYEEATALPLPPQIILRFSCMVGSTTWSIEETLLAIKSPSVCSGYLTPTNK